MFLLFSVSLFVIYIKIHVNNKIDKFVKDLSYIL